MTQSSENWKKEFREKFVKGTLPSTAGGTVQDAESWVEGYPEEIEFFIDNLQKEIEERFRVELEDTKKYARINSDEAKQFQDFLKEKLSQREGEIERLTKELEKIKSFWTSHVALSEKLSSHQALMEKVRTTLQSIDDWFESLKVSQDKNVKEKGIFSNFEDWDNSDVKSFDMTEIKELLTQLNELREG